MEEFFDEVIIDTLIDGMKLLPFLIIAYFLLEFFEHKMMHKVNTVFRQSRKYGSIIGSFLGTIPQCGMSVLVTNLYVKRVVTLGTLISVYLTTSDEALIIFLSGGIAIQEILLIIGIKILIGMIAGIVIDFLLRKKENEILLEPLEEHDHCPGIIRSALKHSFLVFIYILVVLLILNSIIFAIGTDNLSQFILTGSFFQPFLSALIGLVPSCAPSVLLAELYTNGFIGLGGVVAGLTSAAGAGLLVLFKVNKNLKENLTIVLILYTIGAFAGVLIDFIV